MVNDKLVKALLLDDGETLQELLRAQSVVEAMETLTYMSQQATRQDVICNVQAAAVPRDFTSRSESDALAGLQANIEEKQGINLDHVLMPPPRLSPPASPWCAQLSDVIDLSGLTAVTSIGHQGAPH